MTYSNPYQLGQMAKASQQSGIINAAGSLIGGAARMAGTALGVNTALAGVGAVGNFVNRLSSGQDLGRAAAGTVGDTANYLSFGALGNNAGNRFANTVVGKRPEDVINDSMQQEQDAISKGDYGTAMKARMQREQAAQQMQNENKPAEDYNWRNQATEYGRDMVENPYNVNNPNGEFQKAVEQQQNRQADQFEVRSDRQLNKSLQRSYVADNYKSGIGMAQSALGQYLQNAGNAQNQLAQMASMRY